MNRKLINIGKNANDGTGDSLRVAFSKINDNFDEIFGNLKLSNLTDVVDTYVPNSLVGIDSNANLVIYRTFTSNVLDIAITDSNISINLKSNITGDYNFLGNINVSGVGNFDGNVTINGNLSVLGNTIVNDTVINQTTVSTTDTLFVNNTTTSTSTTTGAITTTGGMGVAGNVVAQSFYSNQYFYANGTPYFNTGYTGSRGVDGIIGRDGAVGPTGPTGFAGSIGNTGYTGSAGSRGGSGPVGNDGNNGYTGSASTVPGPIGPTGPQGVNIKLKGDSPNFGSLPMSGNEINDAYIVQSDGNTWVWNGTGWYNAGRVVGPTGYTGSGGLATYDLHNFINGAPQTNEILMRIIAVRNISFSDNFAGSYAYCINAPTQDFVIDVLKNTQSVGTLIFSLGSKQGAFSVPAISLKPSDQMHLRCSTTANTGITDIAIAIFGTSSP